MDRKKHIVELMAERHSQTTYQVFEAAALSLCRANHKAQAHLWWVRFEQAKRNPAPPNNLLGVSPEVINWCLGVMFPPKPQKLLKEGVAA